MNIDVFTQVINLRDDLALLWEQFATARKNAGEITAAVKERIDVEKSKGTERIYILQKQSADPTRSEAVRKIAASELSKLKSPNFELTAEETAAFEEEYNKALGIIQEIRSSEARLKEALVEAKETIEDIKKWSHSGTKDTSLAITWLESDKRDFQRVGASNE